MGKQDSHGVHQYVEKTMSRTWSLLMHWDKMS